MSKIWIERNFSHVHQIEIQVIGPFTSRKIATQYEKRTSKTAKPQTMRDYCYESKITARPCVIGKLRAPGEYIMLELLEKAQAKPGKFDINPADYI